MLLCIVCKWNDICGVHLEAERFKMIYDDGEAYDKEKADNIYYEMWFVLTLGAPLVSGLVALRDG